MYMRRDCFYFYDVKGSVCMDRESVSGRIFLELQKLREAEQPSFHLSIFSFILWSLLWVWVWVWVKFCWMVHFQIPLSNLSFIFYSDSWYNLVFAFALSPFPRKKENLPATFSRENELDNSSCKTPHCTSLMKSYKIKYEDEIHWLPATTDLTVQTRESKVHAFRWNQNSC